MTSVWRKSEMLKLKVRFLLKFFLFLKKKLLLMNPSTRAFNQASALKSTKFMAANSSKDSRLSGCTNVMLLCMKTMHNATQNIRRRTSAIPHNFWKLRFQVLKAASMKLRIFWEYCRVLNWMWTDVSEIRAASIIALIRTRHASCKHRISDDVLLSSVTLRSYTMFLM
jgi:hypothetical protein